MTNQGSSGVDPLLVARLASRFDSLGDHMRQVSVDLGTLQSQLTATRPLGEQQTGVQRSEAKQTGVQQPQFAQPYMPQPYPTHPQVAQPIPPQPQGQPSYASQSGPRQPVSAAASGWAGQGAAPAPAPQLQWRPPAPPPVRKDPWWQRDGVISRVLAVAGAGVTLVGVVMLLVLAAQAGWFGPELRVAAGAILSIGLLGAGSRVFGRPGGRVGGIALAATGIAGLYLDVIAVSVIYQWLEPVLGLVIAFGVAAAGVALAVSWKSQPMAVLILVGVAVCAPVLTDGISLSLIAFLTATYIASYPAQLGRDWPMLHAARIVPVVLALVVAIGFAVNSNESHVSVLVVAALVAVFSIGSSTELLRRNAADGFAVVAMAVGALPILVTGALTDRWTTVGVQSAVAVGCAAVIIGARWLPVSVKIVLALIGSLAVFQAAMVGSPFDARPIVLLVIAAAFLAAARQVQQQHTESKLAYFLGTAFAAAGALAFLTVSPPEALVDSSYAVGDAGVVVAGLLLAVVSLAVVRLASDIGVAQKNVQGLWIFAGLVALYSTTAATVALGTGIGGTGTGFVAGQTTATIEWMVAAFALLALGLRNAAHTHVALLVGLLLTAASIAKLFLFDLVALDGLFRVLAFIVVGVLLLVAGTRYAAAFAERDSSAADNTNDVPLVR